MTYHILNGDALKDQLPTSQGGIRLVARECLVDGPVQGNTLTELYQARAQYLSQAYGNASGLDYEQDVVGEFGQIQRIPAGAEVNMWFEEDLFCQVNWWFVLHLLGEVKVERSLFLVRPTANLAYGFGGMAPEELQEALTQRQAITSTDFALLCQLWPAYQRQDDGQLTKLAQSLATGYPFIPAAVQAEIDRRPSTDSLGRPAQAIQNIITTLGTDALGPVFKAFRQQEAIYGYGDLQVQRLIQEVQTR